MEKEIIKCAVCKGDTQYTKDTPIEERENYSEATGQICAECAKKKD